MLILKQFHHYQEWLLVTPKREALGTERSKSNKSAYWLSKALLNLSINVFENFLNLLMVQYYSSDCIWVYLIMLIIHSFLTLVVTNHELMDVTTVMAFMHRHLFISFLMHANMLIHLLLLLDCFKGYWFWHQSNYLICRLFII